MKLTTNVNHDGTTFEECYADAPEEHKAMLKGLWSVCYTITNIKRRGDETNKRKHRRIGYGLGVVTILAMLSKGRVALEKNSQMIEALISIVDDELALLAFAEASTYIATGKMSIEKNNPVKVFKLRVDSDCRVIGGVPDNLPSEVKKEIRKVIAECKEKRS